MDDTAAMQDTTNRSVDATGSAAAIGSSSEATSGQSALATKLLASSASQPSTPQQQADACSVTSDGSQEQQGPKSRLNHSSVDVDAAKQAALSALAGLDMTTTKANLDASKAAAATARANGEIPTHTRKSSLRSVSCRQLGGSSSAASGSTSTPTAGKAVAFDDASKNRAQGDTVRPGQGQWPRTTFTEGQPRRTTRAPASRCISLPSHVLQGRVSMANMTNRLAASYAQDAALQQQLQMLNGGTGVGQAYASFNQLQHTGMPQVDALSMYQLQNQVGGTPGGLLSQRSFGGHMASLDDSVLPALRSGGTMMMQQQQQQPMQQMQPQQARMAPAGWNQAAAAAPAGQPGLTRWGSGQLGQQLPTTANPSAALTQAHAAANAQLLAQLQVSSQSQVGSDALWMATPAASAALQLSTSRPQGTVMMAPQAAVSGCMPGIPGLQAQQLMSASLSASGPAAASLTAPALAAAPASQPGSSAGLNGHTLLENYQSVSWSVLAAAQGEVALRDQLLTELVLLLTMLHTLNNVLKGSMTTAEAVNDFSYLAAAARRHMATFSRLSQAGNVAVQLLAMITPLACRHLGSAETLEAAFLVLDTLALANRDVANVVTQQRITAHTSLGLQLSVDQLLQQQSLGLHWITSLAAAVGRNKAMLESMAADMAGQGQAAAGTNAAGISAGGLLPMSQPMMMAPGAGATATISNTLSPTRKTPLATYFEETAQGPGGAAGLSAGAAAPGGLGPVGAGLAAAAPPGSLMADTLGGMTLGAAPGAAVQDDVSLTAAAAAGQLGIAGLEKLAAGLSLGVAPGQLAAGAPAPGPPAAGAGMHVNGGGVGVAGPGTFSPLGGGLSLFGDSGLLVPGSSGPSSTGATGLVGV